MRWYCLVNELKPEHVQEYVNIHETAHKTAWKTQLDALKVAGAQNCISYLFGNQVILFYQCEDIDESFKKLSIIEENNKWQAYVAPFFANSPKFDGSVKAQPLRKIFDLNEQLEGFLGD